ncbi:MAG: RluA family pseudouridine synthase [Alphaproteobacteria bacterium]|nr:RluA family pseudouridine synthase [Alphaproteobacteria bacterium]MBR2342563.1 RluA family pseudouridine synthase [Alphaproteobacteria bacterium]MBR2483062.1 RluA family pseudouridine synthase [Alphaproteobacteria bacterium]
MAEIITVSSVEEGTRLLRWFVRRYPSLPQREFYKLCRGGQIRLNSKRVQGKEILRAGDAIRVPPTIAGYMQPTEKKSESGDKFSLADLEMLRKAIIHNDNDIVVFNKPAGLAVQGGTGIRKSVDKMAAALFPYDKISLVHRLDKETSGLLVVAKNQRAAQVLANAFQNKTAHKEYLALLNGAVKPNRGVIDNFVIKGQVFDTPTRLNDGTGPRPQRAITNYQVLSQAGNVSWVLFSPKTGRTHQLRLHSAFTLNAPIVGDDLYGRTRNVDDALRSMLATNNLFLFAYKITFQHPTTGRMITLRAELPEFMVPVIKFLEFQVP